MATAAPDASGLGGTDTDVVVVGAGMAGLAAAATAAAAGLSVVVVEAADGVGGRMRTDAVDGFLLDRGFHVFIEAYEAQRQLVDYDALDLRPFLPGAIVRMPAASPSASSPSAFHLLADPLRAPTTLPAVLAAPVGSLADKARVGALRLSTFLSSPEALAAAADGAPSTAAFLSDTCGFSPAFVHAFFRPFYRGIFLSDLDEQSSALFRYVFRAFSVGRASLPAAGIGAVPAAVAAALPSDRVQIALRSPVSAVTPTSVTLQGGDVLTARAVVVAADVTAARRLLTESVAAPSAAAAIKGALPPPAALRSSTCLYYATDSATAPTPHPRALILNGTGDGPVNNVCFPAAVADTYAPAGRGLVSATIVGADADGIGGGGGDAGLDAAVRAQLANWFGDDAVSGWTRVAAAGVPLTVRGAQVAQVVGGRGGGGEAVSVGGVYVAGDWWVSPTVEGAVAGGRRAGEAVVAALGGGQPSG
ncbi:hypothetical protein MMPV_004508 [Pyropia vietnamensis]